MDRVSVVMIRASLVWLLVGALVGAAMMIDEVLPGAWRVWMGPTHGHMLFVGWFVQFAIGVAYWLFPRRRSPTQPLGYHETIAFAAIGVLNLGLILRVVAEPAQRSGHDGDWIVIVLGGSAVCQVAAFVILVRQMWKRVIPRPARKLDS